MEIIFYILIGVCFTILFYVVYTFFVKRADMYYIDGSFFGKLVKIGEESIFSTQHEGKVGDTSEKDEKAFIALVQSVANSNDIDLRDEGSKSLGKSNSEVKKVVELLNDLRIKKELK